MESGQSDPASTEQWLGNVRDCSDSDGTTLAHRRARATVANLSLVVSIGSRLLAAAFTWPTIQLVVK
jgi:hypothetical protein